ncbi:MAG TPA: hypothetical protein VFG03_05250 [Telluria sp.]|nr:hypothetical protein [Telluria sp.]
MTTLGRAVGAIPLFAALLLAACGGAGTGGSTSVDRQSAQGIAVGEPSPASFASAAFEAQAQAASCAATRNRLFVIDRKMVLWDTADYGCADMSYSRRLYGATPQDVLCSAADSIAGPRISCVDAASRTLFDTILKNLDQPDLGLGRAHQVEGLAVLPPAGTSLAFDSVASDAYSAVKLARNVVLRDAASWATLWAEHSAGRTPAPALPKVDFGQQMLVAVFAGAQANGCRELQIARVGVSGGALVVEYVDRDVSTVAICSAAIGAPMQVLAVARSDAAVGFVNVAANALPFSVVEHSTRSNIGAARQVLVRDAAAWAALWKEHQGDAAPLPAVDFGKSMLVGVFLGSQANGCYSSSFSRVYRNGKKIVAVHADTVPGHGVLCTMNVTTPAELIRVERSDDPVEFASQSQFLL